MKTYSIATELFILRDGGLSKTYKEGDILVLEKYFNDMYNLFMNKLTSFAVSNRISEAEEENLTAMLQELMKVKKIIENTPKTVIM